MSSKNKQEDLLKYEDIKYYQRGKIAVNGIAYERYAVQCHFITPGEDYLELLKRYVLPLIKEGDIVVSAEKVVSMCQNNIVDKKDVKLGWYAKTISKFASRGDHGIGMDEPYKLQLAINLAGLPRIIFATICSAITKLFGKKGVFYKVAGHGISGIDGFYSRSSFDFYKDHAILNPKEPDKLCNLVYNQLGLKLAIADANDFNVEIFGKASAMEEDIEFLRAVMKDNPSGQGDEMTPFIIIRKAPNEIISEESTENM